MQAIIIATKVKQSIPAGNRRGNKGESQRAPERELPRAERSAAWFAFCFVGD